MAHQFGPGAKDCQDCKDADLPCAKGLPCANGSFCDLVTYEFRTDEEIALFDLVGHPSIWKTNLGERPILDFPAMLTQIDLLPIDIPKADRLLYLRAMDAGMVMAQAQNKARADAHVIPTGKPH